VSSVYPRPKNIVVVIDCGNSLSQNQMHTAKAIAKFVLLSLGEADRVSKASETPMLIWIILCIYSRFLCYINKYGKSYIEYRF